MERTYDTREAAEILKVKPETMVQWRWRGRGPRYRKLGGRVIYCESDLRDYLDSAIRNNGEKEAAARA